MGDRKSPAKVVPFAGLFDGSILCQFRSGIRTDNSIYFKVGSFLKLFYCPFCDRAINTVRLAGIKAKFYESVLHLQHILPAQHFNAFAVLEQTGSISIMLRAWGSHIFILGGQRLSRSGSNAIEARGFNYGVVKTKVSQRSWTHWYQCPYIDYITPAPAEPLPSQDENVTPPPSEHNADSARLLEYHKGVKMLRGEDVLQVQNRLIKLGFNPGKADGVYGPITEKAVRKFQEAANLEIDGIVGPTTRAELAKD
jgi:hypothetical protein